MLLDPKRLRKLFAAGTVLAVLVAAGFYLRGILKDWRQPETVSRDIPKDVAEIAKDFKLSRSVGGRTLFTIHAASFQQFKDGERMELHDASITLYGREGDRSDHISGSDFQYDKNTGDIAAKGEVQIDLEATSPVANLPKAGGVPLSSNVIHLKTSGLIFNEKSGLAQTRERLEFHIPDAAGSAIGAIYDSHENALTLKSAVKIVTSGRQKATITGASAAVFKNPQRVVVQSARIEQPPRAITTDKLTVVLRENNTVDRILGAGNIHALREGAKGFDVSAPNGELLLDDAGQLRSGALSGGVTFAGKQEDVPPQGHAGRTLLSFSGKGKLEKVRAEDTVDFKQGQPGKSQEIQAATVDFYLHDGKIVEKAVTSMGPAQITLVQKTAESTITADQFNAKFTEQNRLDSVVGGPNAKIVSSTPGQPDRVTSSRQVIASFNAKGEIASAEQNGDFHYQEGTQEGWAQRAVYNPAEESYVLTGSPRLTSGNRSLTAESIQLNRKTGGAFAQGNVKATYNHMSAQAGGAMLSTGGPIHVTGATMTANRSSSLARFSGARLWRGPDIIEAPTIVFDHNHRSLQAQADSSKRVTSVFTQTDKGGKATPVNVTSDKLSYVDADRKADFSGHVLMRVEGSIITAETVQAFLLGRNNQADNQTGSQLDRIVALGDIQIQQPDRTATGSQLIYTAQDEKFVLTGSPGKPPSIFDAERGQIQGDSLTFFRHDGRVLIGDGESSHAQNQTKVEDASKK